MNVVVKWPGLAFCMHAAYTEYKVCQMSSLASAVRFIKPRVLLVSSIFTQHALQLLQVKWTLNALQSRIKDCGIFLR